MQHKYTPRDFKKAHEWIADEGGELFPTTGSWDWFWRQHREELKASGEVIALGGTKPTLVAPGIGQVVVEIMQRKQQGAA